MSRQDFMDSINIISFMIGLENLEENIDQSTLDDSMQHAVDVINGHLEEQDRKLNLILERLDNSHERD